MCYFPNLFRPLPLAGLLLSLSATLAPAALVWGSFNDASVFGGGVLNGPGSFTYTASAGSQGTFTATVSASEGFAGTNYYHGVGAAQNLASPGYRTAAQQSPPSAAFLTNPHDIPALGERSSLWYEGSPRGTVTTVYDFSGLNGGVLPEGSWLFLDSVDAEVVTASAAAGWHDQVWMIDTTENPFRNPTPEEMPQQIPSAPGQIVFEGQSVSDPGALSGRDKFRNSPGVFVRTAIPLQSLTVSVYDPFPLVFGEGSGQFGPQNSVVAGGGGIAVNVSPAPEPSAAFLGLTAAAGMLMRRRRTMKA